MAAFVLLLWLHVIFFDRIHAWSPPWIVKQSGMRLKVMKVMAIVFALVTSLVCALVVAGAASR